MRVHPAARSLLRFLAFTFERRRPHALPARAYRALALDGLGRVERLVLLEAVSASGLRLQAGSEVRLDHTGSIVLATLDAGALRGPLRSAGSPPRLVACAALSHRAGPWQGG